MKWKGFTKFILTILCLTVSPVHSQINGDLRLAGFGANPTRGKLEIFYNGEWGTVCSNKTILQFNSFERNAAEVACRQLGLGFVINYYTPLHQSELLFTYGLSTGPIHLDQVERCDDSESHLLRCSHGTLGTASCSHAEDVIIECSDVHIPYNGEVRLTGLSSGIVELHSTHRWGAVCSEDGFQESHANAVCRQLGYTGASSFKPLPSTNYSGLCWDLEGAALSNTTQPCFSHSLNHLPLTTRQSTDCTPVHVQCEYISEDVELFTSGNADLCTLDPTIPLEGDIRVENEDSGLPGGDVKVYLNGAWGSVCRDDFGFSEADVVCKQLGHPGAQRIDPFILASGEVAYDLDCSGVETKISDCSVRALGGCAHGARVKCLSDGFPYGELTLLGGAGAAGNLVVYTGAIFQPVCNRGFGILEANVACRQMGYEGAVSVRLNSSFGLPSLDSLRRDLFPLHDKCLGNESHLLECEQQLSGEQGSCTAGVDLVEIQCATSVSNTPALRLVGGPSSSIGQPISGRLEVSFGGVWGTIGDSGFSHLSAHVACTQLGYATAKQIYNSSRYGAGSGPVVLDDVQCSGYEGALFNCPHSVVVNSTRSHDQDVAIECSEELPFPEGTLRLSDGNSTSGRLEIFKHGVWMAVCGVLFTAEDASMACTKLGFANLLNYCTDSCFGKGSGYIHSIEEQDRCTGGAGSLLNCGGVSQTGAQCNHTTTVGLACVPKEPTTTAMPTTTPPTTMTTVSTTLSPPSGIIPPSLVPGLEDLYFYIIVGVACLVVIVTVVLVVVCCVCCAARRRRKMTNGTWRSSVHTNGSTSNGAHSHNGSTRWSHIEANSKLTTEKVGDFDDPRDPVQMNGFAHSTPSLKTDSDPNLDYKPSMSLELEQAHHHYENLPQRSNVANNTLYVEESASPASPPPGYDELEFLPHSRT